MGPRRSGRSKFALRATGFSGKDVSVDAGIATGDLYGSTVFLIKLARADSADDAVGVADVAEAFEGFEEEGFSEAGAARGFDHSGGAEEGALGGLVAGEAEDGFVACGDPAGDRLAGEGDFDFAGPLFGKVLAGEVCHGVLLESACAAKGDTLGLDVLIKLGGIRQIIEAHEHVDHAGDLRREGGGGEVDFVWRVVLNGYGKLESYLHRKGAALLPRLFVKSFSKNP